MWELFGGRPSLVGMSTRVACKAGSVGTSAGSAISGAQTAAAWLARPGWVDGSMSQAAVSDGETVHSEQVEPAVPDVVNVAEDLV